MFKHPYGLVNLDEAEQEIRQFVSKRLRDYFTQKSGSVRADYHAYLQDGVYDQESSECWFFFSLFLFFLFLLLALCE